MRYEILLNLNDNPALSPNVYLDTFDDVPISFNYNIADITDIANKKSSYSKTIDLPNTSHNRDVFSQIFDINLIVLDESDSTYTPTLFNPNRKVPCVVLKDSLIQFEGSIQLTNIIYDYDSNNHIYQAVIYADNDTLFKNVGEKYLSDLDLSIFDHTYGINSITASWEGDYTSGYFYPLIDYGFPLIHPFKVVLPGGDTYINKLNVNNFLPAVYAKTIFDKIFSEAGFSYESSFLNSDLFKNLIIPFSNKNLVPGSTLTTDANNVIFLANKDNSYLLPTSTNVPPQTRARYYYGSMRANVDSFDPNSLYDSSSYKFTNPTNGSFKQNFTIFFNFQMQNRISKPNWWVDSQDDITIWCKRSKDVFGVTNSAWGDTPTYDQLTNVNNPNHFRDISFNGGSNGISVRNVIIPSGTGFTYSSPTFSTSNRDWVLGVKCTTDWIQDNPLFPGEEVRFFATRRYVDASPFNTSVIYDAQFEVIPGSYVYSTIDKNTIITGSPLTIRDILPSKFKQKDFLISIFRMFNLYIEPSKADMSSGRSAFENSFFIEPRDDYYNSGVVKDWSEKLDISKPISTEFISNQQKRTNLFTYKEDKDIYNQNYKTTTNTTFGQFKYEIENDFISGDNIIETSFSPTPIDRLPGSQNIYLPIIANMNNGNYSKPDGMNARILYRKMIPLTGTDLLLVSPGFSYSSYPYAGFATDPLNPEYSFNFGQISSFHSGYTETLNNLFNVYYSNQITELNDPNNRIIEAYFYLTPLDINDFRFNDLIYFNIDNMVGYYRITKIYDYDPSANIPTKVQFIKAINYSLNGSVNYSRYNSYQESGLRNLMSVDNVYVGVINTSTTNRTITPNVAMVGNNNSVAYANVLAVGDSNSSYARNSILIGQSNESTNDQTLVVGDTNIVNGINSIALGSGNLVSTPQSLVIGIGNQLESQDESSSGSQSSITIGNNNQMLNNSGFIYGSNNLIGNSVSNSFIFGNDNNLGFTASGASGSTFDNVVVFGRNVSMTDTSTQSSTDIFIVGSNLNLTQSIPTNTTFLGSENIIIDPNGGFNTPFIISEAVSTPSVPTGQTIIKTVSGFANVASLTTTQVAIEQLFPNDFAVGIAVSVDVEVRIKNITTTGEAGVYRMSAAFYVSNSVPQFTQISTTDFGFSKQNFTPAGSMNVDLTDAGTGITLFLENNDTTDQGQFFWDATLKYQYT